MLVLTYNKNCAILLLVITYYNIKVLRQKGLMMLIATKFFGKIHGGGSSRPSLDTMLAMFDKELENFEGILERSGLPDEELAPYRASLDSEEALQAVFNWYRVIQVRARKPVVVPTLYIWPRNIGNVSQEAAEANAHYVTGPYRFEILEKARNYSLQMEPDKITLLLLEHLAEHAQ